MECLFCQFARKEQETDIVFEDESFIVFKDINPKAPAHLLVVPKEHIESIDHMGENEVELMGKLLLTAKKVARREGLEGYKLQFNVGRKGGQVVDHVHLHLLGGFE